MKCNKWIVILLGIIAVLLVWLGSLLLDGNRDLAKISDFMQAIEYIEVIE